MRHIQFIGSWTVKNGDNYPAVESLWEASNVLWAQLRDMGQANVLPDPNLCVWEAWVEDAGVTLLEADPANYTILLDEDAGGGKLSLGKGGAEIGIDKPADEKPDTTTKTTLESFLKAKGVKDADAAVLCQKADGNATRQKIAEGVIAYCNALPKKK